MVACLKSINICAGILAPPADFEIGSDPIEPLQQSSIERLALTVRIALSHVVYHQLVISSNGVELSMPYEGWMLDVQLF